MSKLQLLVISLSAILFLTLYFVFDTKPKNQETIERTRSLSSDAGVDIDRVILLEKSKLDKEKQHTLELKEEKLKTASDSDKIEILKEISGLWYGFDRADISGHYAEEVAIINEEEEAWSIAGTTYLIGLQNAKEKTIQKFCLKKATLAFENAISINPSENQHRVNLALCFVESPPENNPMKGILMLIDLNKKHPNDISVLNNLARLAIRTGQFEKAKKRLEKVISLDPENQKATCLLVQAYQGLKMEDKASTFISKCNLLSNIK